ncbi:MAG: polyphosphate:AMP phosphotransferase [Deltaproteobacteria bacterium RBG_16_58_17]|nr:MAG: polyphosphate:AMP phosphotransferase [Deltaproteobacteria bacterium RBG_16_58_17]OHE21652.1 MAG: polyphosphate:AMP phosphotransferase [Syntrophobacterales bacterium GWF2_56_9]
MFESAELGQEINKTDYEKEVPELREALLDVQHDLRESGKFQVIILIGGVDGAGKSETVKILNEWMDPRFIETNAMGAATEEELAHPPMWRFWRALPPRGKIGIFFGSWYTEPIVNMVYGTIKSRDLDRAMEGVIRFERMFLDEGALILKFWLHLSKDVQKKRLEKLEQNPETRWRVTETEWTHFKLYDKFRKISERALMHTSTPDAPWIIVEGTDPRYRYLTIGKEILSALRRRLDGGEQSAVPKPAPALPPVDEKFQLKSLDFSQNMTKKEYDKELEKYQRKLNLLVRSRKFRKISAILVFEGSDAAGKGGAVRRVTGALDPRSYRIIPIAAPTEEEKLHPYLWRFWRNIPRNGNFTIFDRSWYGRLLVERVEGFCSPADWMRAYGEINDFEEQLARSGGVVIKFWLSITKDEQLKRFREREVTGFKRFKITEEDWRNRKRWNKYELAIGEMIDRTSTDTAPWTVVEANNKYYARIKILKEICARIEAAM